MFMRRKTVGTKIEQMSGYVPSCTDGNKYPVIKISGTLYRSHRLAWLYVHGTWPRYEIDHINGDREDFRLSNLRDVSHAANMHNRVNPNKNNRSGFLGVSWHKPCKKWEAAIRVADKKVLLGRFDTPEEAARAYLKAKQTHHYQVPKFTL